MNFCERQISTTTQIRLNMTQKRMSRSESCTSDPFLEKTFKNLTRLWFISTEVAFAAKILVRTRTIPESGP